MKQTFEAAATQAAIPDDLKLYWAMWVSDLTLRSGQPQPASARDVIASFEGDPWLQSLAQHSRGELSYEALLEQASNRGQRCEAHYYEGLARARAGDFAAGKPLLEKSMSTGMLSFFEYQFAAHFLDWGEIPAKARPATK